MHHRYQKIITYQLLRTMQTKLTFYFIINFIFLFFFWYYVSAFCGVYKQIQFSWLTGGLISFAISLGVPFVICAVFTSMCLIAFKYKNKTLYTLLGLLNSLIEYIDNIMFYGSIYVTISNWNILSYNIIILFLLTK